MSLVTRSEREHGAVVVIVAVMLPLFALLMSFAIDTSHWWVHKRHLQTQADAAALAGGQGPWLPACDKPTINASAKDYSGQPGSAYNAQYAPSGSVATTLQTLCPQEVPNPPPERNPAERPR